jgi:SAM-dependent methyltransferase
MTEPSQRSHWNAHATRWQRIGAPLRPGASDVEHVRASVRRFLPPPEGTGRALLLGVTPELAEIDWYPPLSLLAVDKSEGMAAGVWPGDTATRRVQVGDWLAIDGSSGAFDVALGDGVFTLMDYRAGYDALAAKLGELLRPGGVLCLRLFCRPKKKEEVAAVFEALEAGRIGNFHVFKWRLAMALQDDATHAVRLADIWDVFRARVPSMAELAARTGFPEAEVATIEGYRDVQDRYSYSSVEEVTSVLVPAFELLDTFYPSYELGERCPHLTLRRLP